jgi:RNA 2',3'-cyclic 3'-phosphodiesterase
MHRIFLAIQTPPEITEKISNWQSANSNLPANFIKPQNLHLTLVPPWQIEDPAPIIEKLQNFEFKKNKVQLTQIVQTKKVIWAQAETNPELATLKNQLTNLSQRKADPRPFLPHVTLARLQKLSRDNFTSQPVAWTFTASNITLYESSLHTPGLDYRILAQTILI